MDSDSWLLYVLLVALILGGGYFAGAEIAFASCNKIRLKTQAESGSARAKTAIFISEHFDNALTTLLIGNNIMHIGCSSLATLLATRLWGPGSVGATTVAITLIVFFVSEMLPKSFCRSHADTVVLAFAGSLRFLMRLLSPVAWIFNRISALCAKLFGGKKAPSFTEDELTTMMESAQASPALHQENEDRLLTAAMAFDHISASGPASFRWQSMTRPSLMTIPATTAIIRHSSNRFYFNTIFSARQPKTPPKARYP